MSQQQFRTNGVYDRIKFPDYEYQEYPKWVTRPNGQKTIVQNLSEELKVAQEDPEGNSTETEQSEKAQLLRLLEQQRRENDALRAQLNAKADEVDLPDNLKKVGDPIPAATPQVGTTKATPKTK